MVSSIDRRLDKTIMLCFNRSLVLLQRGLELAVKQAIYMLAAKQAIYMFLLFASNMEVGMTI